MDGHSSNYYHIGPRARGDIVRGAVEESEYQILLELRVDVCLVNMSRVRCLFSRFRVFLEFVEERVHLDSCKLKPQRRRRCSDIVSWKRMHVCI